MIKTFSLYVNNEKSKALEICKKVKKELTTEGYILNDETPDVVIGFGGDGTLLRWLSLCKYNTRSKYIGVNCGTLGFMQDFDIRDPKEFVKNIPNYDEQRVYFAKLEVENRNKKYEFYSVNEFNLMNNMDKSFRASVYIADEFLENFVGTGLIFCTPTGSTAHNISSVGSIIYPDIEMIQMTPSEAIVNRKIRCLPKSICIPKGIDITLKPDSDSSIKIISDGINVYDGEFEKVTVSYSNRCMIKLTDRKNSFIRKVREKLI